MPTNGQAVKIAHYTRSKFNSLTNKDSATIYYVKETDGEIKQYIGNTQVVSNITNGGSGGTVDWQDVENKPELQDKLVAGTNITIDEETNVISASGGGIDLDDISYMNHAAKIFYDSNKQNQFKDAWQHSLTVDPSEISAYSLSSNTRGKAQYPNGETEGVIIPQGVTSIGGFAFYTWSSNNQPLVIPNSVTSIGEAAFGDWTSNNQPLVIPNSVTAIESVAFGSWRVNNHPLVIPEGVTSIGMFAFSNWPLVQYIEIQAITPPTLAHTNAFGNQNDAPIYVPDASVDAYKTATNWVVLADRIFRISEKGGGYEPDNITIGLNEENKLEVKNNLEIDGGFL